jgi:hypothetical protein
MAYVESIRDAKRTHLTKRELIDFCWSFRFKKEAGEEWTSVDPWWRGKQSPPAK